LPRRSFERTLVFREQMVGEIHRVLRTGVPVMVAAVLLCVPATTQAAAVVVDSYDRATVVWNGYGPSGLVVRAVRLGADGIPGELQTISREGPVDSVRAAIDPMGRVTVVWRDDAGIQAARLGRDGNPGKVQDVSGPVPANFARPQVAVDPGGRATVVWSNEERIQAARLGVDGVPGPVRTLSPAGVDVGLPHVATDSRGRSIVVWGCEAPSRNAVQSVQLNEGGEPGAVRTLSTGGQFGNHPQVAIDTEDRATVVWERSNGTDSRVKAVRLAADGTPGAIRDLSPEGWSAGPPSLAIDRHDRVTVAWAAYGPVTWDIQAVRLAPNGEPGPVQTLARAPGSAELGGASVGSYDRATVVWGLTEVADTHTFPSWLQSTRLDASGAPGPVQTLTDPNGVAGGPQIAVDSHDRSTVVWTTFQPYAIQETRLSPAGVPGPVRTLDWNRRPFLDLDGKREQLLRSVVRVRARCSYDCTAAASGVLEIGRRSGGPAKTATRRRALTLKPARAQLAAMETASLKPELRKEGRRLARRALRRDRRVVATVEVTVSDQRQNSISEKRRITLTR
jgi:hypothetical protein